MNNSSIEQLNRESIERDMISVTSDFESLDGEKYIINVDKNAPGLFLFDIDGTIVDAKKIHTPAIIGMFRDVFGSQYQKEFSDPEFLDRLVKTAISYWGIGDKQEFDLTCRDMGLTFDSEEQKDKILDRMVTEYGQKIEEGLMNATDEEKQGFILPGVIEFLEEMKKRNIPAALVTGNSKRSATAFAEKIGFAKYFITGGYDDDPNVIDEPFRRENILKSSIEKCRAKGMDFMPPNMAIFGDTPKDFKATFNIGEIKPFTLLFATGDHSLHDLAELTNPDDSKKPHLVLPSFTNIKIKEFFDSLSQFSK